jgi:sugar phosphate isomerase/epimerase
MSRIETSPAMFASAFPDRRAFLACLAAAAARARVWAAGGRGEPIKLRLGIDTYTLRALRWKAFEMLDYAASMRIEVVQFSEWPHLGTLDQARDDSFLKSVRAHAQKLGIGIEMGTWTVCPTNPGFPAKYGTAPEQLGFAIHIASVLGSKSVRCVMGSGNLRLADGPLEKHVASMIGVCRAVRDQALAAGVHVAIENHKDLRATEMRDLIETAGRDYVGVCLDTGNAIEVLEDPLETVEALAPYTVTSHFRDTALWEHPRGAAFQWTAMGDGSIDIGRVVRRFAELCPQVPMNLEIITGRPPKVIPYREGEFWQAFPNLAARDFMRFVALVEKGQPLMAGMMVPDNARREPAFQEAVRQQQRVDFERSVKHCRAELGVAWGAE